MKCRIVEALSEVLGESIPKNEIERLIEIPPSEELGDFAFPCFSLSKVQRRSPTLIAQDLKEKLTGREGIDRIAAVSGYVNFFMDKKALAREVLQNLEQGVFGERHIDRKVVIEFSSPNTNKPLHLGHLRNMAIGESVARILEFNGNSVVRTSINNDRGVHICKSMLAYHRYGGGATPQEAGTKPDHFVGDYYVLFNRKAAEDRLLDDEAQELLRKWEAGDRPTVKLWETMTAWALEGFKETYDLFGVKFDKEYFESDIYKKGKEIVLEGLEKGIFEKKTDGATVVDLAEQNLGEKVLLRSDGTSVYIVQDLYLAGLKHEEFNFERSIYVVGNEQDHHFNVLFAILRKLDLDIADKVKHLSYGMVELPEGKMKSREGTVVDADDLIKQTQELAKGELRERYDLSEEALGQRSSKIALSAIKYQLLKVDIAKNVLFDPRKAISFEGDTGPYLLYSYARASSILRKAGAQSEFTVPDVSDYEVRLLKKIAWFPDTVRYAYEKLSPSFVANYAFELSQLFNEFYHTCQVLKSRERGFRLELVRAFRSTVAKCLCLLSIETIEEM